MIWIEIVGRHGVEQRVRAGRLPMSVGRGYGNDVVLDDPLVEAAHLRLSQLEDGTLQLEDLGTLNGTQVGSGAPLRGGAVLIRPGQLVRIGHTHLRIVTSDMAVAPAVAEPAAARGLAAVVSGRRAMILLPVIGILLVVLRGWLGDTKDDPASMLSLAIVVVLVVAAWAGAWALGGRLAVRQSRFAEHNAAAWIFVIVASLVAELFAWLDFFTESSALDMIGFAITGALFVLLLEMHLRLASAMHQARRFTVALTVTAGLALVTTLLSRAGDEFAGRELAIGAVLKPVSPSLVPAKNVEDFLRSTDELKAKIDADEN